jgi:hypothetical protein
MSGKEGPKPNQALFSIMKISQAQMEERRRKGLCYSYDSRWTRGHVCVVPKLFLIEVLNEDTTEPAKALGPAEDDPGEFFLEEFPEISLNAITGTPSPKTMRLIGFLRFQPVVILIDSRSMPTFLDTKLALKLGIQPLQQDEIRVQVANGEELTSPGRNKDVDVKMQGFLFRTKLFVLLLVGCDVVLGIHWLRTLGPILWDFTELRKEFQYGEGTCILHGLKQGPQVSFDWGPHFKLPKQEQKGVLFQLMDSPSHSFHLHSHPAHHEDQQVSPLVEDVLQQFANVLTEP